MEMNPIPELPDGYVWGEGNGTHCTYYLEVQRSAPSPQLHLSQLAPFRSLACLTLGSLDASSDSDGVRCAATH